MQKRLSNPLLYLLSFSAGIVVANLYYSQPLLNLIASSFHVTESAVANVPLATQLGYAAGLLFIMPLGDKTSNIKILTIDFVVMIVSLIAASFSSSLFMLIISSFFVGLTSVIPQLFVPMAAELSDDEGRGRAIGIVMSGLLIGIIGSRVISGFIGGIYGWRMMYYVATVLMVVLFVVLYFYLPRLKPSYNGTYKNLMQSIWRYTKKEPALQLASIRGALSFAGLSAFWTTLVFVLQDSFQYGSSVAGLFGILGITGALGSVVTGKLENKYSKNRFVLISTIILILSWAILSFSSYFLLGLIVGTVLVDLGQQVLHITNQNVIFNKFPEARNRVNTVYMVAFFIGGAIGTSVGALAYQYYGWIGVSVFCLILSIGIGLVHFSWKRERE